MKLQGKYTLTLFLVSLITTAMVGSVAYWSLMADFRQSIEDKAFNNFQGDLRNYLIKYGSLENGYQQEPFDIFVRSRHRPSDENDPQLRRRPGLPPFHFLVLDPEGRVVVKGGGNYPPGEKVPEDILSRARPIVINGNMALQTVQIGDPVLTDQDLIYLQAMRKALFSGVIAAGAIALLLGLVLGNRLSSSLRILTNAIRTMRLDGQLPQNVAIRSKDEIGDLAAAFNAMNRELCQAHSELRESHDKVQAQARELKKLSIRDPLTSLFNRRHFDQQANHQFTQALRYRHPLAVMVGDLDHFKQINDSFSHAIGDEVLRRVAKLLEEGTRKTDLVARYGGEEFVILFPETDLPSAFRVCEKLRRNIEDHPWQELHPELRVTISIGLGIDQGLENIEKLIALADENLYQAKNDGRNRVIPAPDLAA